MCFFRFLLLAQFFNSFLLNFFHSFSTIGNASVTGNQSEATDGEFHLFIALRCLRSIFFFLARQGKRARQEGVTRHSSRGR
jgi:hypothetical protein